VSRLRALALFAPLALLLPLGSAAAQEAPPRPDPPTVITIPTIGLTAPVVAIGLEDDGSMGAPTDPDTVGWYDLGPGLGEPGNLLVDGHVDWGGRLRTFGRLRQVAVGDGVQLADADGQVVSYRVVATRWLDADTTDLADVFGQTPDQQLTLITCGGEFDLARHVYLSRLVVRAVRDDPPVASDGAQDTPLPFPFPPTPN